MLVMACMLSLTSCDDLFGEKEGNKVELPKEEAFYFSGTTITAQVHGGNKFNSSIKTVTALASVVTPGSTGGNYREVASASWSNGGFTLELPATLDESFLCSWRDVFRFTYGIGWQTGTENAQVCLINGIAAYNAAGKLVDELILYNPETDDMMVPLFLYTNMDLSFMNIEAGYMLKFKKGWNRFMEMDYYVDPRDEYYDPNTKLWWYFAGEAGFDNEVLDFGL